MIVLGIETSCDETAVAIVEDGVRVLASEVSSQIAIHAKFGGVIPEIAAREHLAAIYFLYEKAIEKSQIKESDIDLIAVTQGPGLIGALLVGISFARGLSDRLGKPIIPVNHVHAHVHGALLGIKDSVKDVFPSYALVISGGHSHIYRMQSPVDYDLKLYTIDDACGECFDKVGKLMGLPYPGGPHIEKRAKAGDSQKYPIPKVLADQSKQFFSYSGLKTHMVSKLRGKTLSEQEIADHSASFQREAFRQIVDKLEIELAGDPLPVASILIAGGVAANLTFRAMLAEKIKKPLLFPDLKFCSDNAAMIAASGWYNYQNNKSLVDQSFEAFSSYPYEQYLT